MMRSPLLSAGAAAAVLLLAIFCGWREVMADLPQGTSHIQEEDSVFAHLKPEYLDLVTFGHREVATDYINLLLLEILYPNEDLEGTGNEARRSLLRGFARTQPTTPSSYLIGCSFVAFESAHPEDCDGIAREGVKALPQNPSIPMMAGYIATFIQRDPKVGARWFREAVATTQAPAFLESLATQLEKDGTITDEFLSTSISWIDSQPGGEPLKSALQDFRHEPEDSVESDAAEEADVDNTDADQTTDAAQ